MGIIKIICDEDNRRPSSWMMWGVTGEYEPALESYRRKYGKDPTHVYIDPPMAHKASDQINWFAPII